MKVLALDMGDVWVGSALSDSVGITCRPYETVKLEQLQLFLQRVLSEEPIDTVVVGHPITMDGRASEQTKRVEEAFEKLKKASEASDSSSVRWVLWDERLSSKRAAETQNKRKQQSRKKERQKEHSIAAAFILQCYLDSKALHVF